MSKINKTIITDTGYGCYGTAHFTEESYDDHLANLKVNEADAPEVLPSEPQEFWYLENGELKVKAVEASEAEEAKRQEALKKEALEYQRAQQSENELGILHGYSVSELATKPKALAQIQWMTSLFNIQKLKAEDTANETPFDSVGDKPYSFTELYDEKFGSIQTPRIKNPSYNVRGVLFRNKSPVHNVQGFFVLEFVQLCVEFF